MVAVMWLTRSTALWRLARRRLNVSRTARTSRRRGAEPGARIRIAETLPEILGMNVAGRTSRRGEFPPCHIFLALRPYGVDLLPLASNLRRVPYLRVQPRKTC